MKLTIDRARWGRGSADGRLFNSDTNLMCCLGFLGKACGLSKDILDGVGSPSDEFFEPTKNKRVWASLLNEIKPRMSFKGESFTEKCTTQEQVFIRINDDVNLTPARRERLLTKEFAAIEVDVRFVGEGR